MSSTSHQEDLLDSALEESFPSSDPVSVYVPTSGGPDRFGHAQSSGGGDGVAWIRWIAGGAPVVLGLAGVGVRMWMSRRAAAARVQRRQQLAGVAVVGALVAAMLAVRAEWRARRTAEEHGEDPPLFV